MKQVSRWAWSFGAFVAVLGAFVGLSFFLKLGHDGVLWIEKGSGSSHIAAHMRQFNLPACRFNLWIFKKITCQTLKNGEYQLEEGWSLWQACWHIASGRVVMHKITIPEGWTSYQIAEKVMSEPLLSGGVPACEEGSLLPETYYFARGDKRSDLMLHMRQAMDEFLRKEWDKRDSGINLSRDEMVVLASIIESETPKDVEKPTISGVFYNRLGQGMRLQSDPTVVYAMTQGREKLDKPLTYKDLRMSSPFNTYVVEGLPPGPIACPGKAALVAAMHPQRHRFIYFVADGTGGHVFSETFDKHKENIKRWRLVQSRKK